MPPVIAPPLETSIIVFADPPEAELRLLRLEDSMLIGRLGYGGLNEPGPIQLFDPRCSSGRHARIRRTSDGTTVHDMGSTNTTLVNGERTADPHLLRVGDQIQTGRSLFRFEHTLSGDPWPPGARALLDEILARPEDDGPRSVLADWLTDRGDPRGELISCQLADTPSARARAADLLAVHELAWAAPLPIPVESWTFSRGFLALVRVRDLAAAELLREHHPLATIEPILWERVD